MSRVNPPSCIGRPPLLVHLKITGRHSWYRTAFLFSKILLRSRTRCKCFSKQHAHGYFCHRPLACNTTLCVFGKCPECSRDFAVVKVMFSAQYAGFCKSSAKKRNCPSVGAFRVGDQRLRCPPQ